MSFLLDTNIVSAHLRRPAGLAHRFTQIDATDRQIDELVYELYGLTADEIRIVEDATG
jgi:hypothetical protein